MISRRVLWLLLALSILRGLLFAGLTPPFEAPDEMTHAAYVEVVATQLRTPLVTDPLPPYVNAALLRSGWWQEWRADTGYSGPSKLTISAAPHPPLYYLVAAPVFQSTYRFGDNAWLLALRLLGVLMATGAVYFAYLAAAIMFPKDKVTQIGVPLFLIILPQLGFITSSVNNDALLVLCGAILAYGLARFIRNPNDNTAAWIVGLATGAGMLTKASFAVIVPPAALCVLAVWAVKRSSKISILRRGAVMAGSASAVAGWWYVKNLVATGYPLPVTPLAVTGSPINKNALMWAIDPAFLEKIAVQFWADFGWTTIRIDNIWYLLASGASLAALAGLVLVVARPRLRKAINKNTVLFLGFSLAAAACALVGTAQFDISTQGGGQGRYLFVAIVPVAALVVYGLRGYLSRRTEPWAIGLMALTGSLFTYVCIAFYIAPFYYG